MKSDTEMVSPIELHIGDHVQRHGALFEVMHIVESECDIPGGIRVAACISRVIGDVTGNIPRGWLKHRSVWLSEELSGRRVCLRALL
jgi:hypothetical protein